MHHPKLTKDTAAWIFQVWISFILALGATMVGVVFMPVDPWVRGFIAMGVLFTVTSSFTLAKTLRDNHEADKLLHRLSEAQAETTIRRYSEDEFRSGLGSERLEAH